MKLGSANMVVKRSMSSILAASVVKKHGGVRGMCIWVIGTPVPFAMNQGPWLSGDDGPILLRQRSLASIILRGEVRLAVIKSRMLTFWAVNSKTRSNG